ncbi:hypothetical protein A3863_10395 [Priestia endophytica]|uniref:hypothetical protein n=1 Tax=Priestia endophytica TaxID=135735 RepID=UPI000DCA4CBB|nr:hypothetical protein [Priestia endophytica]RAS89620.1 hypothetical protein A3863_10395 [Priestia endophytica]
MKKKSEFYDLVSNDIRKWIDDRFLKSTRIKKSKARGVSSRFTDDDLIEIAVEVKTLLKGEKIYPNLLEKVTGIGRQTWKRRIPAQIEEINAPVIEGREFEITNDDDINHINIDFIVQKYQEKPNKLIDALYHIEESRIQLYRIIKDLRREQDNYNKYRENNERLLKENNRLKEELDYYIHLSNTLSVSSYFPNLRKRMHAKEDYIDINSDIDRNLNVSNLNDLFPSLKEIGPSNEERNSKERKVGEELFSDLMDKFGEMIDD